MVLFRQWLRVSRLTSTIAMAQTCAEPLEFEVMQPGSTVATALSEGESAPKQAVLLQVSGTMFKTNRFALQTVRPFIFESVRTSLFEFELFSAEISLSCACAAAQCCLDID